MSEEKPTSTAAKEEVVRGDVFIRMNDDEEKDYCFHVENTKTFGDLIEIFKTLPLNLSPSIYYERIPVGFKISTYPGYLTREGGLLFGYEAAEEKYLKPVPNDALIFSKAWNGQLLIPVFPERTFFRYTVNTGLVLWLYCDLPEFISPTPGLSPTIFIVKGIWALLTYVIGMPEVADKVYSEIMTPAPPVGQCRSSKR
ncbi:unnamed protein product [Ambrosiozyma monospora]|uniref:Unnamed protein product n=1 Tax=Ambrosiozyma monospora TaxID=43982 RepID=A0ACB5T297_AMBMO|nr:unnamed protein product [Ambrosiozyma monospora]